MFAHQVVRVRVRGVDLLDRPLANTLWTGLGQALPSIFGAVLMPDHLHLLLRLAMLSAHHEAFMQLLARLARSLQRGRDVFDVPPPREVAPGKLPVQLRYLALNPCRDRRCADPLQAEYSTYRELYGATTSPIVDRPAVLAALQDHGFSDLDRFHAYVSGDPSVDPRGTPPPAPLDRSPGAYSLREIGQATVAALRTDANALQTRCAPARPLFVATAEAMGHRDPRALAAALDVTRRNISHLRRRPPPPSARQAALTCLADPRFRHR